MLMMITHETKMTFRWEKKVEVSEQSFQFLVFCGRAAEVFFHLGE